MRGTTVYSIITRRPLSHPKYILCHYVYVITHIQDHNCNTIITNFQDYNRSQDVTRLCDKQHLKDDIDKCIKGYEQF